MSLLIHKRGALKSELHWWDWGSYHTLRLLHTFCLIFFQSSLFHTVFSSVVFCFTTYSPWVELGLVSLCLPDWQCGVCDRPERHQSPIRSTALINLFKQTGSRSQKKSFQSPSKNPLKGSGESDTSGGVHFHRWPGTWALCPYVYACLCGKKRRLWVSVFMMHISQAWGVFWGFPDARNLTSDLCVLSSVRQTLILERKGTDNIRRIRQLNIAKGKSWTTTSLLTPSSLMIHLHLYPINQPCLFIKWHIYCHCLL